MSMDSNLKNDRGGGSGGVRAARLQLSPTVPRVKRELQQLALQRLGR